MPGGADLLAETWEATCSGRVDMARIKQEALAELWARRPARDEELFFISFSFCFSFLFFITLFSFPFHTLAPAAPVAAT